MDNERISNCWYKDVCTQDCTANCIRYVEMKHLMDTSDIPKNMQVPKLLEASDDYKAFCICHFQQAPVHSACGMD